MIKIIQLKAENIKRLKAVEITPAGDMVELRGKNGQGKSSVLDSIIFALTGKESLPKMPVREGEEEGTITLDIGNYLIKRRIRADGVSTLKVESKDGAVFKSPQTLLNEIVNGIGFDPLEFSNMKPKDQAEELKKIVKIEYDFEAADASNKADYDERTIQNRIAKEKRVEAQAIKLPEEMPLTRIDVSRQMEGLRKARAHNEEQDKIAAAKRQNEHDITVCEEVIAQLEEQLKNERENLDALKKKEFVIGERIDEKQYEDAIASASNTNKAIDDAEKQKTIIAAARAAEDKSEELTKAIAKREKEKSEAIAKADMPIPGLSFGDGVVLYNGVPFEQCSQGEKIRVSCAIAMSMAKEKQLRVVLIKDGSLLDEDNFKTIADMATEKGYQVWIERVGSDEGNGAILIEDGMVKGQTPAAPESTPVQ